LNEKSGGALVYEHHLEEVDFVAVYLCKGEGGMSVFIDADGFEGPIDG